MTESDLFGQLAEHNRKCLAQLYGCLTCRAYSEIADMRAERDAILAHDKQAVEALNAAEAELERLEEAGYPLPEEDTDGR